MTRWAVKVKRYGGGESVIGLHDYRFEAEEKRDTYNDGYQTDAAYVEEWKEHS